MKKLLLFLVILIPLNSMAKGKLELRLGELSDILKGIEGISTEVSGNKLVIRGSLYREEDLNTINRLTKQHRTIVNLSMVSPV